MQESGGDIKDFLERNEKGWNNKTHGHQESYNIIHRNIGSLETSLPVFAEMHILYIDDEPFNHYVLKSMVDQ